MDRVKCYRNLNRSGVVWSVVSAKTGLVVDRASTVYLADVKLAVSQAGRLRVLNERRKNVHAFVKGRRLKRAPKVLFWHRARYNPYKAGAFILDANGREVSGALYAKLTKEGLFVADIREPVRLDDYTAP